MRSLLAFGAVSLALAFAACVSQTQPEANGPPGMTSAEAGSGSDMECHDETPTGSTISHQVCRPKTDHADQENQPGVMNSMQGPNGAHGKGQ